MTEAQTEASMCVEVEGQFSGFSSFHHVDLGIELKSSDSAAEAILLALLIINIKN